MDEWEAEHGAFAEEELSMPPASSGCPGLQRRTRMRGLVLDAGALIAIDRDDRG